MMVLARGYDMGSHISHRALHVAIAIAATAAPCSAHAEAGSFAKSFQFAIPPGNLSAALSAFSATTGLQVVASSGDVGSHMSAGISGKYKASDAIARLLAKSGYTASLVGDMVVLQQATASPRAMPIALQSAGGAGTSRPDADESEAAEGDRDIIVTAERREQRLVDVPVALSAFGGEQLRNRGADRLVDLASQTPGVLATVQVSGGDMPTFTIRGVGFDDLRPNGNPATSLNIDGIYQGSAILATGQFFDIERVEILKGPQGTLYGQNSTAGAINILSRRPGDKLNGYVSTELATFGTARMEGAVGGPISPIVSARIAALYTRTDGYMTDIGNANAVATFRPPAGIPPLPVTGMNRDVARSESIAGRAIIEINPSDRTEIFLKVNGTKQTGGALQPSRNVTQNGFAPNARYEVDSDVPTKLNVSGYGITGSLQQSVGDDYTFVLTGGYSHVSHLAIYNGDGVPIRLINILYGDKDDQEYAEIRFQKNDTSRFSWIVGATAFHDDVRIDQTFTMLDTTRGIIQGDYTQKRTSFGVFGDGTWAFDSGFKIGGGLRYTHDKVDFNGLTQGLDPYGVSLLPAIFPLLPYKFDRNIRKSQVSGRIYGSKNFGPSSSIYASIRRGYKGGGFDATTPSNDLESAPFGAETVWSYELGFKILPRRAFLQLEGAIFFNDYKDIQTTAVTQITTVAGVLSGGTRVNAGDAQSWGAELSATIRPTDDLKLEISGAYLGNEIKKVISTNPVERLRRADARLPFTPGVSLNGAFEYTIHASDTMDVILASDGQYLSKYYFDIDNFAVTKSRFIGNARVELRYQNNISATAWVRNLTDTYYPLSRFNSATTSTDLPAAPRTYGITLGYKF
jgi:iron complex outermembrane receptor protein